MGKFGRERHGWVKMLRGLKCNGPWGRVMNVLVMLEVDETQNGHNRSLTAELCGSFVC